MTSLSLSPATRVEIVRAARDVAGTISLIEAASWEYRDMVGAALDLVDGIALVEVNEAVEEHGFDSVLLHAGTFVPNFLPRVERDDLREFFEE